MWLCEPHVESAQNTTALFFFLKKRKRKERRRRRKEKKYVLKISTTVASSGRVSFQVINPEASALLMRPLCFF